MKILISGGAGFIGSYLCEQLFAAGHEVVVLDCLSPQIHPHWEGSYMHRKIDGKCTFIKGSVTNRQDWIEALDGVEAVVHLAAETGTGQSMYEIDRYYQVNVQGTAILLDILVNEPNKVRKIIYSSSRAIYGEGKYHSETLGTVYPGHRHDADMAAGNFELRSPDTGKPMQMLPTDEASKQQPSSVYGHTKQVQEHMLLLVGQQLKIPVVALRFQNVYGPGQSLANPYTGLLAVFSNRIRNGNFIDVYEDGQETRDFVYVTDVVDSIVRSLGDDVTTSSVYNVGSGVATPIIRVAQLMNQYFGADVTINISGRYRVGDIRHNCADISLIQSELGFEPKVSFEEGLQKFVQWVTEQELVEDRYDASIAEIRAKGLMK